MRLAIDAIRVPSPPRLVPMIRSSQLEENPEITQVKLMEAFNLSRKQIQKIIKDLREEGLVERQGSNRNGRWVVKK